MKKLCFFILLLSFKISFAGTAEDYRIVIDPGHGGNDFGAVRDSFVESKIVLEIAKKLKTRLEEMHFTDVHLTREKDESLSLKDRVKKANELGADLFVSLHANTSNFSGMAGMEFYFNLSHDLLKKIDPPALKLTNNEVVGKIKKDFKLYEKTEKSLALSKSVQELTSADTKGVIKRAPFYVIENTEMPAVLIELGFISNRREAQKLTSSEYQNELANQIAAALLEYKEKSDKESPVLDK